MAAICELTIYVLLISLCLGCRFSDKHVVVDATDYNLPNELLIWVISW